jgi:hypothetical protein
MCNVKVAKCKQSSILTYIYKILIHYNCTYCQKATDEKIIWKIAKWVTFLDTLKVHQNLKLSENKTKAFLGIMGL